MTTHLFVYGTLRRDCAHAMSRLLAEHGRFVGNATVRGRLYDLGAYPGMVAGDGTGDVTGELYEMHAAAWDDLIARLDAYEGPEYRRTLVSARVSTGEGVEAWAYVLHEVPADCTMIECGDYLTWRRAGVSSPLRRNHDR